MTARFGNYGDRVAQSAGREWNSQLMASHIAESACSEIPPSTELKTMVKSRPVFSILSNADPTLPVQPFEGASNFLLLCFNDLWSFCGVVLFGLGSEFFHVHAPTWALSPYRAI